MSASGAMSGAPGHPAPGHTLSTAAAAAAAATQSLRNYTPLPSGSFPLLVSLPDSSSPLQVDVPLDATVSNIKDVLAEHAAFDPASLELSFAGDMLEPNTPLINTNIVEAYEHAGGLLRVIENGDLDSDKRERALESACAVVEQLSNGVREMEVLCEAAMNSKDNPRWQGKGAILKRTGSGTGRPRSGLQREEEDDGSDKEDFASNGSGDSELEGGVSVTMDEAHVASGKHPAARRMESSGYAMFDNMLGEDGRGAAPDGAQDNPPQPMLASSLVRGLSRKLPALFTPCAVKGMCVEDENEEGGEEQSTESDREQHSELTRKQSVVQPSLIAIRQARRQAKEMRGSLSGNGVYNADGSAGIMDIVGDTIGQSTNDMGSDSTLPVGVSSVQLDSYPTKAASAEGAQRRSAILSASANKTWMQDVMKTWEVELVKKSGVLETAEGGVELSNYLKSLEQEAAEDQEQVRLEKGKLPNAVGEEDGLSEDSLDDIDEKDTGQDGETVEGCNNVEQGTDRVMKTEPAGDNGVVSPMHPEQMQVGRQNQTVPRGLPQIHCRPDNNNTPSRHQRQSQTQAQDQNQTESQLFQERVRAQAQAQVAQVQARARVEAEAEAQTQAQARVQAQSQRPPNASRHAVDSGGGSLLPSQPTSHSPLYCTQQPPHQQEALLRSHVYERDSGHQLGTNIESEVGALMYPEQGQLHQQSMSQCRNGNPALHRIETGESANPQIQPQGQQHVQQVPQNRQYGLQEFNNRTGSEDGHHLSSASGARSNASGGSTSTGQVVRMATPIAPAPNGTIATKLKSPPAGLGSSDAAQVPANSVDGNAPNFLQQQMLAFAGVPPVPAAQFSKPMPKKRGRKRKNPGLTEEERALVRKLQNRESAKLSRVRRKVIAAEYEDQITDLVENNKRLHDQVSALNNRLSFLQSLLTVHVSPNVANNTDAAVNDAGRMCDSRTNSHIGRVGSAVVPGNLRGKVGESSQPTKSSGSLHSGSFHSSGVQSVPNGQTGMVSGSQKTTCFQQQSPQHPMQHQQQHVLQMQQSLQQSLQHQQHSMHQHQQLRQQLQQRQEQQQDQQHQISPHQQHPPQQQHRAPYQQNQPVQQQPYR